MTIAATARKRVMLIVLFFGLLLSVSVHGVVHAGNDIVVVVVVDS